MTLLASLPHLVSRRGAPHVLDLGEAVIVGLLARQHPRTMQIEVLVGVLFCMYRQTWQNVTQKQSNNAKTAMAIGQVTTICQIFIR